MVPSLDSDGRQGRRRIIHSRSPQEIQEKNRRVRDSEEGDDFGLLLLTGNLHLNRVSKNQRQFLNFDPLSFRQSGSVPALFFMRAAANADADAITG